MCGDARVAARHGVEHAGHPFGDVVAHNVFDEQRGQDDAHGGVDQEEEVGAVHRKPVRQSVLDGIEQNLEQIGADSGKHADDHRQKHHHLAVGEPPRQAEEQRVDTVGAETHVGQWFVVCGLRRPPCGAISPLRQRSGLMPCLG